MPEMILRVIVAVLLMAIAILLYVRESRNSFEHYEKEREKFETTKNGRKLL